MDMVTRVQILDEGVFTSHCAYTFGKGVNSIIFPSAMDKIVGQSELFSLGMATSQGEEEIRFQTY